jgi:predicted RecB family nuclease
VAVPNSRSLPNCPTKCHLRSLGERGTENIYANWFRAQNDSYRSEGIKRLVKGVAPDEFFVGPASTKNLKMTKWRLAVNLVARAKNLDSSIQAVEKLPLEGQDQPAQFIPIRFIFTNKLTHHDKLLLGFDVFALSEMLGGEIGLGKIIHGDNQITLKVKTAPLTREVRKLTEKIVTVLSNHSIPDLALNRHCAECEFQDRCRQKAIEADDLSLLSGMTEKERRRHRNKGIFTVNQLSYTFRPRRMPKRAKNPAKPHYLSLQALSIRENTVYIHGNPQLPNSKSSVYLDIEGLPDNQFYYLIGALVVSDGKETFHTFWADHESDEPDIFAQFVETIYKLENFRILHYGDYESVALRRIKARLPECFHSRINMVLERTTNVLSVVHPHIYFPTYSNSLKEIGKFLRYERTQESATGLQTIAWRKSWEANGATDVKTSLVQYNQDDCQALRHVCEFIRRLTLTNDMPQAVDQTLPKIIHTDEMIKERPRWELFRPKEYALVDFKHVSKCAYFDYQREKVFVRTHRQFRIINKRHRKLKRTKTNPNRVINIECKRCPKCKKKNIEQIKQRSRLMFDLKFSRTGVKKWITKFDSYRYKCLKCGNVFSSEARSRGGQYRYGHALMSWCVYSNFFCGMNMSRVRMALGDMFDIFVDDSRMIRSRRFMAAEYEGLYCAILESILKEKVLHVDETSVRLRGLNGYVWVLVGIDKAYYFYRPSREGSFLQEMLHSFSGVLISDFYVAYDSLPCEQQKCLVHIVRDIDDDLLKNPLDTQLKDIAQEFGTLLRPIIQTVDRYGLKSRHLRKHKPAVFRFLDSVGSKDFSSEMANKYRKRFRKSGAKMFTFLDHDGVPWNNTNAEHAIKRFAKFRTFADGRFTERSLKEYLVLVSIFETCAFNNVNVLKFLLSKEMTLEGLFKLAGLRAKSKSTPIRGGGEERDQSMDDFIIARVQPLRQRRRRKKITKEVC